MQLGPFTIDQYIASGAAGSVWTGRHVRNNTPVAIKILEPKGFSEALPEDVRTELEALAGMAHPNIVWVYDFGWVPEGITTASGAELTAGSIWLAMELADATLKDTGELTWPQLKSWTDQLLDALGYAHARGVLHRDVKPQNVLLSGPDRTLKLSDFGIAMVQGQTRHVAAGTMYYMAPEQELGDLPQLGPSTDLFALGVMIWRMVCGEVPYRNNGVTMLFPKMKGNFLPFQPQFSVPKDLEAWLKSCMAPAPSDRFACAADARHALESLGAGTISGVRRAGAEEEEDEATVVELATTEERVTPLGKRPPAAPMVTDWRRREVSGPHLLNAGLELFGMRAFPTVGREEEREKLWRALVEVRRTGLPKVALITGASGMGRKHLARWLGERAAETGAANLMRFSFAGGAGLLTWLNSELMIADDDEDALEAAMNSHEARWGPLSDKATAALTRALEEETVDPSLHDAFGELVALRTTDRPVVVLLEEAGSVECWNMVRAVRDREQKLPVLFVATVREDLRERVPDVNAEVIELEPLDEESRVPFIRQLLGLEPALSVRLARITAGSPGFAIAVCDHWARQGVLEPGPRGYQLAEGADGELPSDATWREQLTEVASLDKRYGPLLATSAVLGPDVHQGIWSQTTKHPDATTPLLSELIRRRLARRTETGWTFTQAAFREAILGDVGPRMPRVASRCADVLAKHPGNEERLAWTLLQARRWDEATAALFAGAERAATNGRFHDVIDLVNRWPEVASERTLKPADRRNAQALILRFRALQSLAQVKTLVELANETLVIAPLHGWKDVEAFALILLVRWNAKTGDSVERLQRALALLDQLPDSFLHAELYLEFAQVERDRGNHELSVEHNRTAIRIATEIELVNMPRFQTDLAQGLCTLERYDEALELAALAEKGALEAGTIWVQATAVRQQGEILFTLEDWPKAQAEWERSMLLFRRIGDGHEWYLRANMGLAMRMQGDIAGAREHFEACLRAPIRYGEYVAWLGLLSILEDPQAWHEKLDKLHEKFIDIGYSTYIFARMFEFAGDFCLEKRALGRAARVYAVARQQYAAMNIDVSELDAVLAKLPAAEPSPGPK